MYIYRLEKVHRMESRSQENAEMFDGVLCFLGVVYPFFLDSLPPPPFLFITNPVPTPLAPFLHGAAFLPALSNSPALPCQVDSAKYRKYSCRGNRGKTPPRGLSGATPPPPSAVTTPLQPPLPRRYFRYSSNITSPPTHTPLAQRWGCSSAPSQPYRNKIRCQ